MVLRYSMKKLHWRLEKFTVSKEQAHKGNKTTPPLSTKKLLLPKLFWRPDCSCLYETYLTLFSMVKINTTFLEYSYGLGAPHKRFTFPSRRTFIVFHNFFVLATSWNPQHCQFPSHFQSSTTRSFCENVSKHIINQQLDQTGPSRTIHEVVHGCHSRPGRSHDNELRQRPHLLLGLQQPHLSPPGQDAENS